MWKAQSDEQIAHIAKNVHASNNIITFIFSNFFTCLKDGMKIPSVL